jgi:small subunit ribosomal protein S9
MPPRPPKPPTPETPNDAEAPAAEAPEAEAPEPPDPEPAEVPAEEPDPEIGSDEPPSAAPEKPEQPLEQEEQPEEEAPASAAEEPPAAPEEQPKTDLPPGAELEPIAIADDTSRLSAEERARIETEAEERAAREAEATAERPEEPIAAPVQAASLAKDARYIATGKRKSSVARVIVKPGDGAIEINSRAIEEYFPRPQLQTIAKQALVQAGYEGTVDVRVRVHGGGISGQAAAVRHGIARALTEIDPNLRGELKKRGMLTRDARVKERYKAGLKKARKRPQFSKR